MANLTDTGVNGDLRVTGKIYGTVNAVNVNDANLAVPAVGTGDYVGSTGDYFVGSGSGRNLPDTTNNFNIHATVTHYTSTTYRVSQIATPTSSTNPTGIYERCGISSNGTSWTFGSWMSTPPTSHASSATTYGVGTASNYGHVKLDNSTPLTVGSTSSDGVATGKAHKHNNLESVARADVTTVDLDHVNNNTRAHMILSQVSSSTGTTHDPGDGYMLTFMWDTNDPYDAQLYIPVDSTRDWGRIKIRYRDNNSSGWGDWGYIRLAATSSVLTSSNNLDNVKGSAAGQILSYNWSTNSVPTNAPVSSATSMMIVYQPHASYCYQAVITAQDGIFRRICKNGTWTAWTKDLDAADIATGSANGTISVAGTDVAVKGLGGAAYLNTGTTSGTVATGNHTHTTTIASDSSSGTVVTLAHDTQYKLTAGGTSVLFKTPADSNTDTKVTQTVDTSNDASYPLLAKNTTATATITDTSRFTSGVTLNPKNKSITATTFIGALSGNATTATSLYKTAISYHRPVASSGDGKQWCRLATLTEANIASGGLWYGVGVVVNLYVNPYGVANQQMHFGTYELVFRLAINAGSGYSLKTSGEMSIRRLHGPDRRASADGRSGIDWKIVRSDTKVEFFIKNSEWDSSLYIEKTQEVNGAGNRWVWKVENGLYTDDEFATYCSDKTTVDATLRIAYKSNALAFPRKSSFNYDSWTQANSLITAEADYTGATNAPSTNWFYLLSMQGDDTAYAGQIAFRMTGDPGLFIRQRKSSAWNSWYRLLTTGDVTSTYSATGTSPVNGTAVESAISGAAGNYMKAKPNVTSTNMNLIAAMGNCGGMASLTGTDTKVNPNGKTGWHHFLNLSFNTQTDNMWQTQIANAAGTTDLWVRSRSGGTISDSTAWAAPWTRILTGSNWSNVVTKSALGLGNVNNTSDADKPVSTAQQTALDGKVNIAGDTMTGRLTLQKPLSQVITGTGTAAVTTSPYYPARWKYDLGIANPTAGDRLVIKIPCAGHDNGVFISTDNGTTYYPVARHTGANRLTTHYPNGAYICVVFEAYVSGNANAGEVDSVYPPTGGTAKQNYTSGCWRVINDYDANSTYSGFVCGYCSTAAGTAAKEVSATNYSASVGNTILVRFTNTNSAAGALTLKAGGVTKTIKWNGTVTASGTTSAIPAGTWPCYYDGTNWCIWTDGTAEGNYRGNLTGNASTATHISNHGYIRIWASGQYSSSKPYALLAQKSVGTTGNWGYGQLFKLEVQNRYVIFKIDLRGGASSIASGTDTARILYSHGFSSQADVNKAVVVTYAYTANSTCIVRIYSNLSLTASDWQRVSLRQLDNQAGDQCAYNGWDAFTYYQKSDNTDMVASVTGTVMTNVFNTGSFYGNATSATSATSADHLTTARKTYVTLGTASTTTTRDWSGDTTIPVDGTLAVSHGGTGMTTATNVNAVVIGNSTTANSAMQTVRTGNGAFYATAQDAKPTFGTLPAAQGGTGKTSAKDACNAFINALDTGSSTPVDADYYVSQYVSGGTTTTTFHRRPMSALWTYVKGKMSSDTGVNISGNAATATKINTSAKIGDTNKPVYIAADGTVTPISYTISTSVPSGAVFTDTKQRIIASDAKTYITGVTTAPTSSNQDLTGVANTNVYATAGQLHATTFDVNSKCTLQFNTTTNALDFVFA